MAKFVPDAQSKRWVVITPVRVSRPDELQSGEREGKCPFCPGSESMTPPEIFRIGGEGTDWKVRVFPNKYPITDLHEVIVHSPDNTRDVELLDIEQVRLVLTTYRERYKANEKNGQVLIFCNHGESAGASLRHPHSQLVVIPNQITLDVLVKEPINNVISDNNYFVTYCPDFSQWPYEVWIAPKVGGTTYGEIKDEEISDLAEILQEVLLKMRDWFMKGQTPTVAKEEEFTYNYYIYPGKDWYIRIIPRFVHRAGFELGTGLNVNIKDPAEAAAELKIPS
jgi:UDPglucose--hexose-1-phosphate uridylyltransferase